MERTLSHAIHQDDKHQHLWYSCVILLILIPILGWHYSLIGTIILGLAKEIWDHFCGSGFCWYDMLANVLGILLGLMLFSFWSYFF